MLKTLSKLLVEWRGPSILSARGTGSASPSCLNPAAGQDTRTPWSASNLTPTITKGKGLSSRCAAATPGETAVIGHSGNRSGLPRPGSGGALGFENGRKLDTHGHRIASAAAVAAPDESHPADSVPGSHRSDSVEAPTLLLNQHHEATLQNCHPERNTQSNL